jgi:hypothetical protein
MQKAPAVTGAFCVQGLSSLAFSRTVQSLDIQALKGFNELQFFFGRWQVEREAGMEFPRG